MFKRIIVAGSRNYHNYQEAESYINFCICRIRKEYNLVFVSGGCRGADALGERYAISNGYAVERHPAKWQPYGKAAGPIRNRTMIMSADYVICFWDYQSRGTASLIEYAKEFNKLIRIKKFRHMHRPNKMAMHIHSPASILLSSPIFCRQPYSLKNTALPFDCRSVVVRLITSISRRLFEDL